MSFVDLLRLVLTPKSLFDKLIEAILEKLIDLLVKLISLIFSNRPKAKAASVESALSKLLDRRTRIWTRLESVDQRWKIEDKAVLFWLSELRAVAFDIDDLEDEFKTRLKLNNASRLAPLTSIWYYWGMLDRIEEINKRYDVVNKDRKEQKLDESDGDRVVPSRKEPIPPQNYSIRDQGTCNLHGRQAEKAKLLELLHSSSNENNKIEVISITGEGGVGKTALAEWAYHHQSQSSNKRIWVTLSPDLDVLKTIKKIIESITKEECKFSSLEMLQHNLQKLLSGEKFFLVLDSVWSEDPFFWENLRVALSVCNLGSKVLVTTRSKITSVYMGASDLNTISLTSLDAYSCYNVLMDQALNAGPVSLKLETIGREIANRCNGSPLAAKLLGKILSSDRNEDQWQGLLAFMPSPDEILDNILPLLRLSYDSLPPHLKTCFKYCAIFPKGYEFNKDDLVKMWISENLIKSRSNYDRKRMEIIGRTQFNDLLSRSFFQLTEFNNKEEYIMPGAIHDLAQSVSEYECLRLDFNGVLHGNYNRTRYGSLCADCVESDSLKNLFDKKFLRTIIVYRNGDVPIRCFELKNLVKELKCLRTLNMSYCDITEVPECISDLIHLRYLNLRGSKFETLPDSICKLLNLETLELGECYNLKKLPDKLSGLTKICHIGLSLNWDKSDVNEFESMPSDLGNLTHLQTLSRFIVSKKEGYKISELKKLDIHGEICISKLENVNDAIEAKEARLDHKKHIEFLFLKWSCDRKSKSIDCKNLEQVIENLSPADTIKKIYIEGYNGSKFPNWIDFVYEPFSKLENIKLSKCRACVELPKLGNLPQLKKLYIQALDKIEDLNDLFCDKNNHSSEFKLLEELNISDMPELKTWFELPNGGLNKLSKLIISNCPSLRLINSPLPSLCDLVLEQTDSSLINWIQTLTSLTYLSIIKISGLEQITQSNLTPLIRLKELKIEGCRGLESIAKDNDLKHLCSLTKLEISSCPKLESFSDKGLPDKIEVIKLKCLNSLNSLPQGLSSLEDFHMLEIDEVCNLKSIQLLPKSLDYLYVKGCKILEEQCEIGRPDWDNIKHVKCLHIG